MPLSQVQIIRSLGEALAWFEKELSWGVDPAELRHLTGRIGELYAAMITRGQMALSTNQRGYDVISAAGERISVKTVTSSNHVLFRKNTFADVERVIILRILVDEGEASIEEIDDFPAAILPARMVETISEYRYPIRAPRSSTMSLATTPVHRVANHGPVQITQLENGTIHVDVEGSREAIAKPILRQVALTFGVDLLNGNGNPKNTRQLGSDVIEAINIARVTAPPA